MTPPRADRTCVRKWERRFALTAEYGAKGGYGWLIGLGSQAAYGEEEPSDPRADRERAADIYSDGVVKRLREGRRQASTIVTPAAL